jgi:hypothetical protein
VSVADRNLLIAIGDDTIEGELSTLKIQS